MGSGARPRIPIWRSRASGYFGKDSSASDIRRASGSGILVASCRVPERTPCNPILWRTPAGQLGDAVSSRSGCERERVSAILNHLISRPEKSPGPPICNSATLLQLARGCATPDRAGNIYLPIRAAWKNEVRFPRFAPKSGQAVNGHYGAFRYSLSGKRA